MDENMRAECYLQNIVQSSMNAKVSSAETHRLSAISNIKNALCLGDYSEEQSRRLKRMVASLEGAANDTPQRKFECFQTVLAALSSMGLVETA